MAIGIANKRILDPNIPVGVCYLPATDSHPPLRIFYPADDDRTTWKGRGRSTVGWFQDTGVVPYLLGYLHTIGIIDGNSEVTKWLVQPCVHVISWFLPMRWLKLPGVYQSVPPCRSDASAKNTMPLVVFSHGLTGTGQENSALCASWAQQGRVVVGVHHTDGSSCRVQRKDGSILFYQSPPALEKYDATFRPFQLQKRSSEVMQARQFLLHKPEEQQQEEQQQNDESSLLDEIRDLVDPQRVVAAGYSYGAATVAQTVTQIVKAQQQRQQQEKVSASDDEQEEKKNDAHSSCMQNLGSDFPFQAAMFLDGWFHIDVQKSAGIEFESPPEAFAYIDASDDDDDNDNNKWPVPSLFVDSQQFQGFSKLFKATKRLARAANTKVTVLANTGHQNFCDVIFWLPLSILQILMMGAVGETDPLKAYQDMLDHTQDFLNEKVGKVRSRDR